MNCNKALKRVVTTMILLGLTNTAMADEDDRVSLRAWNRTSAPGVVRVDNAMYREECGSCHMAYSPGLLPAPSWERLMGGLDNHFGENVELPDEERTEITNYLLDHAAGRSGYRLSQKLLRGMQRPPLRITQLPYFRHEHREIPARMVQGNPEVRSFSHCDACHARADQGSFREREVRIPGHGRFED